PASAPMPRMTQEFGVVPPVEPPSRPASPRPTTVSIPAPPEAPAPAPAEPFFAPFDEAPSEAPRAQPPGMLPRSASSERPLPELPAPAAPAPAAPRAYDFEPSVGVAAGTPIELPDEMLVQLNRPLSELMVDEEEQAPAQAASAPVAAPALHKPLELPPELMNAPSLPSRDQGRNKAPPKGKGRGLLIAGGVLVLALTAFLTSPAWLSKSGVLPHKVQAERDGAVAQLRRDDVASKEAAISQLNLLLSAHPKSVELLAEVGIAVALHLDDTQVSINTFDAKEKALAERIDRLTTTQTPVDWQSRVNTRQEERAALQKELYVLRERAGMLSQQVLTTLKRLDAVPETEPREFALARLRARGLMSATLGLGTTPELITKLAQAEQGDWSSLVMAEYVLHQGEPSSADVREAAAALERIRTLDSTYLRAYMLGARLAILRHEPASAQALLDSVITLNPKHELAQQLHGFLEDAQKRDAEPPPPVTPPEPTPVPTPVPTPAPTDVPPTEAPPAPPPAPDTAAPNP
ncbi:MAG: hypothetical protein ABW123_13685, partial [Cystobacter sp.]